MQIAVVDTGIANIGSVCRVLCELGAQPLVARDPAGMRNASRIILPGVGSFSAGMASLKRAGFDTALPLAAGEGKQLLGICLGMQLLADHGSESGGASGLGLIAGTVDHMEAAGCKERLPHMGWNSIEVVGQSPLADGIPSGTDFYFVHSYAFAVKNRDDVVATCDHGGSFVAMVSAGNVHGAQFHPEKSAQAGFRVLRNFLEMAPC